MGKAKGGQQRQGERRGMGSKGRKPHKAFLAAIKAARFKAGKIVSKASLPFAKVVSQRETKRRTNQCCHNLSDGSDLGNDAFVFISQDEE